MTIILVALLPAAFAAGALMQSQLLARRAEEGAVPDGMTDYFRDVADRLADQVEEGSRQIMHLRRIVADQAVIVRAALGRPQKRTIPGGTR